MTLRFKIAGIFCLVGWAIGATLLFQMRGPLQGYFRTFTWKVTGAEELWPTVERIRLYTHIDPPGGFLAEAELELTGLHSSTFGLMLNRSLSVESATDGSGREIACRRGFPLMHGFHREGRVLLFTLDDEPPERLTLRLRYSGEAETGTEGSDWRGILYVDEKHLRMSEQTIFYPQVPLRPKSPAIRECPFEVVVDAPADIEVFVPGPEVAVDRLGGELFRNRTAGKSRRLWGFACERPSVFSIMGGKYHREERTLGNTTVVSLLFDEHKDLAASFTGEMDRIARFFSEKFGPLGGGSETGGSALAVVEIHCRSRSSYNWASQGLVVFDRLALSSAGHKVPVGKLAHELAHLWWGQSVRVAGEGERFLTEGLAEYSSWRYLEHAQGLEKVLSVVAAANRDYLRTADKGRDTRLRDVVFSTPGYQDLAYQKGALALRHLEASCGREDFDAALREYHALGAGTLALDDFFRCLDEEGKSRFLIPWVDFGGHCELELSNVRLEGALRTEILARRISAPAEFPLAGDVDVAVRGKNVNEVHSFTFQGATTPIEIPIPQGASVEIVELDPHHYWLMPHPLPTVIDGARLVTSAPAEGAEIGFGGRAIELEFDTPLAPVTAREWRDRMRRVGGEWKGPGLKTATLDETGTRLSLQVTPLYPDRTYELPLRHGLRTRDDGEVFTELLTFTTSPSDDRDPPRILSADPPNGATIRASTREFRLTFSETMKASRGYKNSQVKRLAGKGYEFPRFEQNWEDDHILVITLEGLEPGKKYGLPFKGNMFQDLSGNEVVAVDYLVTTE